MKQWLWRAWTANRERIADCGTASAETKERAAEIARITLGGPHRAKVVEFQVDELDEHKDVVALRAALGEACDMLERTIDELAAHESDPAMMDGHREHLARWRAVK